MKEAVKWLFKIFPVPIIVMGTLGNILCIIVCRRRRLREHAFSICLIVLAVADTISLNIGFWRHWVEHTFTYELIRRSSSLCKLSLFLPYCSGDLSTWVLCLITVQRFISVWLPTKAKSLCSHKGSSIGCTALTVLSIIKNIHFLTVEYKTVPLYQGNYTFISGCEPENTHYIHFLLNEWGIFDLIMAAILPFTVLAVCNSMIIAKLWRTAAARKSTVETSQERKITNINVMLTINSMVFLILVMPWYLIFVIQTYSEVDAAAKAGMNVALSVALFLWYINPAINFYMYCLGGPLFRSELKALFRRGNSIGDTNMTGNESM